MSMGDICNGQIRMPDISARSAARPSLDPELLRQLPPGYGAQAGAADRAYMSSQTLLYLVTASPFSDCSSAGSWWPGLTLTATIRTVSPH